MTSVELTQSRATTIRDAHRHVEVAAGDMLKWAIIAGRQLTIQKIEGGHGNWLEWLEQNVPGLNERSAQHYMQLADAQERGFLNTNRHSDLSITGALKLIQKPKPKPAPSPDNVISILREERARQVETAGDTTPTSTALEVVPDPEDWTSQQDAKHRRLIEQWDAIGASLRDARGLREYGAREHLGAAHAAARRTTALIDDLARSF